MRKMLLVMVHEFWRHVKRRGFIFSVLGLPILGVVLMAGTIFLIMAISNQPVGIVDYSGQLLTPERYRAESPMGTPLLAYEDETIALVDLELGSLQGVVVVAADYLESGQVTIYHQGSYFDGFMTELQLYLRTSLLTGTETAMQSQLRRPPPAPSCIPDRNGRTIPAFGHLYLPLCRGLYFYHRHFYQRRLSDSGRC